MIFKLCPKHRGVHTHLRIYVGEEEGRLAFAGKLIFRREEATTFIATMLTGATHSSDETSVIISYDNDNKKAES